MPLVGGGGAKVQIDFESRVDKLIADSKLVIQQQEAIKKTTKETNQEVKKAAEEAERANKKQTMSLTDVYSAVRLVQQGFQLLKQGYDFAKEGANIQFTAERFDRLAQSIGTTGDVLLGKMKVATKGTLSDLEAMAAATDILSLGLADTQEQAIRLATVQSGLAMDTNQLVLALTNQTTMRFDQLGVSVKGFEEKVKSLEAAGYSAQDAFTEAFLQQAEEQLLRVGNAADAAAGQFKIFEANTKNSVDELKEWAANAVLPAIRAANEFTAAQTELREEFEHGIITEEEYIKQSRLLSNHRISATSVLNSETSAQLVAKKAIEETTEAFMAEQNALEGVAEAAPMTEEQIKSLTKANEGYLSTISNTTKSIDSYSDKEADLMQKHQELLAKKQELISQGWWVESDAVKKVDEDLAKNAEAYAQNASEFEMASRTKILSMFEQQLAIDGLDEKETAYLLELGLKWGVYSQEAVDAAKAAQEEVQRLTDQFNSLPTSKDININVNTNYTASGQTSGHNQQNSGPLSGGYADGGISRGPASGHVELLHGDEAVIPLKNGSVPVEMKGGGTTININVSGGMGDPEEQAQTISQAVKRVLRQEGVVYAQ